MIRHASGYDLKMAAGIGNSIKDVDRRCQFSVPQPVVFLEHRLCRMRDGTLERSAQVMVTKFDCEDGKFTRKVSQR